MSNTLLLFILFTGAIAATLFFLQGAFHIVRSSAQPEYHFTPIRKALRFLRMHTKRLLTKLASVL